MEKLGGRRGIVAGVKADVSLLDPDQYGIVEDERYCVVKLDNVQTGIALRQLDQLINGKLPKNRAPRSLAPLSRAGRHRAHSGVGVLDRSVDFLATTMLDQQLLNVFSQWLSQNGSPENPAFSEASTIFAQKLMKICVRLCVFRAGPGGEG
jgi:hypothetical protein